MARRGVDLRDLGALHGALLIVERLFGKAALYRGLPVPVRVGMTFTVVLFTWVFLASDLPQAVRYVGDMLALGDPQKAPAAGGIVYRPATWGRSCWRVYFGGRPQTWDWTRTITLPKAAAVMAVFFLSVVVLATQAYNPFIYFIF